PEGGQIHLASLQCYWLSEMPLSWFEAQDSCRKTPGRNLASADSQELQHFIFHSFPLLLSEQVIMVYPDDIVAVQHTLDSGTFLHCLNGEASLNSLWRQSYLSISGTEWGGWLEGGLTSLPHGSKWVDGVVCDLRMLYVDTLHRATEHDDVSDYTQAETTTAPDIRPPTAGPNPSLTSKFRLNVIHPLPDEKNQIHVQINVPTLLVVKALFGEKARSSWSAPVLQTGVPFLSSCPEGMVQSSPGCKKQSQEAWFSSVTLLLPSAGVQMLNISVMDAESFQNVSVKVCGYEAVTGLTVEPHGCLRMLIDTSQDYTLHVHISNQYDNADASMKINVRPQLKSLLISPSTLMPLVKQTLYLETSIEPSDFLVFYTWDYGDGSKAVQSTHHKVSHSFGSAGVYNITVCASNTLTSLTAWLMVVVMEKISGLTVTYSGPNEVGSSTHIKADVVAGTSLKWDFDFGDGFLQENLTDGSIAHIYKFPGNYTVDVTVSNSVSQAHRSINVEVYSLTVSGVFPTECVMSGKNIQFSALVNGNVSSLTFHWLFGEDSSLTVVTGRSTAMHTFPNHGIFHVNLTVFSSVTSVAFSSTICVESPITTVEVQSSQDVVAAGEEVCFRVLVSPEQKTGYKFKWLSNSSELAAVAENSQKCFVFRDEGVEEVSVTVRNKVSTTTAKAEITIQKPVSKFSIAHDGQIDTLTVNTLTTFWVLGCTGSNASVLWDFGDGSPVSQKQNVSHVFTSTGQFIVTATAFNAVSRDSSSLKVNIFLPVSDLSLHTNHPYAAVGEETLITAISSAISSTNYYWTVEGITSTKQGTYQFRFTFPKPGVHRVKVIAQNLVSKMEAAIIIEVLERIEGLQIECQSLTNEKYVSTLEDLLFIATVTKGSNVTYHWLVTQSGTNRQITGDGELFHVLAESPGSISVQLKASNILGDITSTVSVVAVERVTSAHIATLSNIVALGKLVNISVFVDTGSDLQYFWYVNTDLPPLQTHVPFLLHTFTSLGQCLVRVSVQNFVSQSNDTTEFLVQEEVQGLDFQINSKKDPFYVNASAALSFHGFIRNGSDLRWDWKVATAKQNLFTSTSQTFIYRFLHAGIHQVYLNVSNRISWQVVSHSVTVQESIKGLLLNISKSSLCIGEQVTVLPTISKGSNVTFGITFQNKDWIHRQDISEGHFTTSSLPVGRHLVTVKALNQVSSAEASSSIIVSERIQGFRLVNCCSTTLEALKAIQFKADIQSGFPVHYTWIFHLGRSGPTRLMGQKVTFTSPESGSLSVSVLASNGLCSETINDTVTVEWPVKKVNIVCHSEKIFVGHSVRFSAVNEGSNVRYLWDFGDSTEVLVTDLSAVNHTYFITGNYSVTVKVLNSVSHVSTQLYMKVEDLQCSSPQASLLQSESTIFRSRPSFFEASVNINCSAYKTTYLWEIYRDSNGTKGSTNLSGNKVALKSQEDATSPFLLLPKHVLDVGCYSLVFTVSFHGTPLLIQRKTSFTVVHSPLVAVIKGGSHRLWPSFSDLVLDGSECHDPDVEPGGEDTLQYHWAWMTANSTESPFVKQPTGTISNRMTVLSTLLHPGTVYIFTLTVHKKGRSPASVNQTVWSHDEYLLQINSSGELSSYERPCQRSKMSIFERGFTYIVPAASTEDHSGLTLDLDELTTSTGRHSPNLVVRSGVLQPGRSYTFALDVSQPGSGQSGSAILTIQPNNPPHGGQCDLSPESDIRLLETVVTYSCSGTLKFHSDKQMEFEWTAVELMDRREIRENVTQALASLPVSSLLDVDQISSALSQSTVFSVFPGSTLAAVSSSSHPAYSSTLQAASVIALSALSHAGALMRTLMHSRVHEEAPLSLSTNYINTFGFQGDPSDLLCTHHSHPCQFHIPTSLTAHLRSQRSEVVQVLFDVDGALESNPLLTAAEPPISTTLVAMELSTPQGQPIPIQDLDPEQAIRVTLPNKYPVELGDRGGGGREGKAGNGTCLTVTLPTEGRLNFTVKALDDLDENAGLYISFNFSLAPALVDGGPVHVSVCVFSSLCQYYSVTERRWRSDGLQPLEGSTLHAAQCLTQHLTMFGASLFVHPGAVVLLPPVCETHWIVCAVLVLIHLLVGLIAHKLDHLDSLRLSQLPLCGRPGLYHYRVLVKTGWRPGAGTTAHVGISLYGVNKSGSRHLQRDGAFQRGSLDQFHVETDDNLGEVWKIRVWHDNTGLDPSWYVQHVVVWDPQTDHMFFFLLEDWLSVENQKNGTVEKEVLASCPEELTQFGRVLTSQLMFGMVERHLWLSLWERPAHSSFTRGQRVTCSALVLHLYLALGALWYGAVSTEAHLLVNMETVAVGMTVAVLVFPLQCFFCFLFRKAHSQVTANSFSLRQSHQKRKTDQLLESKALNSSILDFWAASGLAPQTDGAYQEKAVVTWPSCDSLLNLPAGSRPAKTTLAPDLCKSSPVQGPTRQLRRKKALMQLHLASPVSPVSSTALLSSSCTFSEDISNSHVFSAEAGQKSLNVNPKPVRVYSQNLTTLLTLSGEKLFKFTEGNQEITNSVARGQPSRLLPPWALCVIYPLVAVLLGACLAVVGLYGSFFSRTVVLMWLTSALSAFLTSALLLEPLKVSSTLWRPVDPEVEEQLAQETTVVRAFGEHSGKVRPPCGYGLLQAKEEARKVRALRSLMRVRLLGTLRFVRRWVVIGRVLQRAWRELWALTVLVLLLLLLCTHLGNTVREGKAEQAELFHPAIEPQDYEMVEFFIKRLKLWMGLTKAKQFRHRVKFEGMDIPPSRSSQDSHLSTLSSTLPPSRSPSLFSPFSSPRPLSSALSIRSEDSSVSDPGFEVQPYLDNLLPCVNALLSRFDRVNQITEDIHNLEIKLEEVQARRRKARKKNKEESEGIFGELRKPKEPEEGRIVGEVRHRKTGVLYPRPRVSLPSSFSFTPSTFQPSAASVCIFPRKRNSYSESESGSLQSQPSSEASLSETPKLAPGNFGLHAGSPGFARFPRRRAWYSGSSHSADAAQRALQLPGAALCRNSGENLAFANTRPRSEEGVRRQISDGVPVKRKAWLSEGPETE
uniref:Polycystic kidney disease 1b n=1 Tax=Stegastes partitus TaxID=144197 RepID=A0A3B5AXN8_9TELE